MRVWRRRIALALFLWAGKGSVPGKASARPRSPNSALNEREAMTDNKQVRNKLINLRNFLD
jgi:hypothetical protein